MSKYRILAVLELSRNVPKTVEEGEIKHWRLFTLLDEKQLTEAVNTLNDGKNGPLKRIPVVNDPVTKPAHYTDGNIEVMDYIEDKQLGFALGNTVKYISRAGKKDPSKLIEDLKKARWYLDREIQRIENSK